MRKIIVPYDERETVEKLGAVKLKYCYYSVPSTCNIQDFHRWNRPPLNDVITGEDRTFGRNFLYVDLIPSSSWYTNAREYVDAVDWERIKELCKMRAGYKCELCKASPDFSEKNYLECHERFLFDKETKKQTLVRFICVCTKCHQVIHFGLSQIQGRDEEARSHLMKVNKWNAKRVSEHIADRFEVWEIKNEMFWELDLSMLKNMDLPSLNFREQII